MSFYFDIAAAILTPAALLAAALNAAAVRDLRRAGRAITLSERRIAILTPRKARALARALESFLSTPAGTAAAADPRVAVRLHLLRTASGARTTPPGSLRAELDYTESLLARTGPSSGPALTFNV